MQKQLGIIFDVSFSTVYTGVFISRSYMSAYGIWAGYFQHILYHNDVLEKAHYFALINIEIELLNTCLLS